MREENIKRLSGTSISKNSAGYIVLYFLINDLKRSISTFATGKILDVGCGNKPYESLFNSSKENYIGCDVVQSSEMKVDIICKATEITADTASFDTVFSTQVMEHVDNSDKMMSECNRVLKPGGHLILSVPLCWELHEEPYDFFRFTKYGLKELCDRNNFEVVEIIPNGGKWAAITQMNLNMIYSTFKKKNIFIKCIKGIFIHLRLTALINWIAIKLDHKFYDPLLTLNYVLIARKKA
ncbi:MAG: methyltransferase domain-containing protein [Sphingobacteriales bacterium]|nr:MAG: methyltransferase domain-containing protein [Sphingobacteriales bacterium]